MTREYHEGYQQGYKDAKEEGKEPTTKNDLGVDCISREDVLKLIYDYKENHFENREEYPINYGTLLDMIRWVRNLPSVTPQEPKTGHWIDIHNYHYYNDGDIETTELRCSCCYEEVEWDIELLHKPYYCENCGCRMVEPQESEDK